MGDLYDILAAIGSAVVFAGIFIGIGFWAGMQVKGQQQRPRDERGRFRKVRA